MTARRRHLTSLLLLVVVIGLMCARYLFVAVDPPYGIVSQSGTFLTDEGWWTKNAQLWAKFGVMRNAYDSNLITHSAAFTVLMAVLFEVLGPDLWTARYAAITASVLSLVVLYAIARMALAREAALLVVIASAITLHQVTYARMAIIESFGTLWSILAIYWLVAEPHRLRNQLLSLGLAVIAVLTKTTFAFTLLTVTVVLACRALGKWRSGDIRAASSTSFSILVALAAAFLLRAFVGYLFPEEAIVASHAIGDRVKDTSLQAVLSNEWRAASYVVTSFNWRALFVAMGLGLLWAGIRRMSGHRIDLPPEASIVALWTLAGVFAFGAFAYQPPRYFYFVSLSAPLIAIVLVDQAGKAYGWRALSIAVMTAVVSLHAASQLPHYRTWYWRGGSASFTEMARAFASQIEREAANEGRVQIVVMGPTSSVLSLFGLRLRPTDFGPIAPFPVAQSKALIGREDDVCSRAEFWRPQYTVGPENKIPALAETCPQFVQGEEEIGRRRVMNQWYFKADFVLRRVTYRPAPAAS